VASPSSASAPMMLRMDRFCFPRAMPRSRNGNDDYDLGSCARRSDDTEARNDFVGCFGRLDRSVYERAGVMRGGADFASRAPAHPLRLRLRSIWPTSDLSADELVVPPATHPLSPRPRKSFLPLNAGSVRSAGRS
jgi:hypothetical protein